jgi:hypothetical protein
VLATVAAPSQALRGHVPVGYGRTFWVSVPINREPELGATALDHAALSEVACQPARQVPYSSWRRHQKSLSLRPSGARSSHW